MKRIVLVLGLVVLLASQAIASDVAVWGDRYSLSVINNFYNSLAGVNSTVLGGTLDSNNLSGIELLWAVQPADSYTAAEIAKMQSFLQGGGRIAFMGEHGGYAPDEDARITAAIAALGGHISINLDYPDSGYRTASVADGQILAHSLTEGVNQYHYACFASLNISGSAVALMVGEEDPSQIMMAYENIGAGSIFLITDQNVWDDLGQYDNHRMFENLLLADTGAPPVSAPEPATMMLMAFGLAGLAGLRKRLQK